MSHKQKTTKFILIYLIFGLLRPILFSTLQLNSNCGELGHIHLHQQSSIFQANTQAAFANDENECHGSQNPSSDFVFGSFEILLSKKLYVCFRRISKIVNTTPEPMIEKMKPPPRADRFVFRLI